MSSVAPETRVEKAPAEEPVFAEVTPSERSSARQFTQTRPERQPREFTNDSNNRSRRNRRNRNGRERFNGDSMPNADQPYAGELVEVEGLLDLRDDGYGFLRTKSYHPRPTTSTSRSIRSVATTCERATRSSGATGRPPRTRSTRRYFVWTASRASTPRSRDCVRTSRT